MIKRRLAMGAVALASVVGMAAGPVVGAGAGVTPHVIQTGGNINCANCTKTFTGLKWVGNGTMTIAFKDVGVFGDSFIVAYSDAVTSPIVGHCSVSSLSSYKTSLRVHIPSSRTFKLKVAWCGTSARHARFPAGFKLRTTP